MGIPRIVDFDRNNPLDVAMVVFTMFMGTLFAVMALWGFWRRIKTPEWRVSQGMQRAKWAGLHLLGFAMGTFVIVMAVLTWLYGEP